MTDPVVMALARGGIVDITTKGRRTGEPHRVEISLHNIDRELLISGRPGPRDWYANLLADPRFTFHLKGAVKADLPAIARPILEPVERREVMARVAQNWGRTDLERMLVQSPLVEVSFEAAA